MTNKTSKEGLAAIEAEIRASFVALLADCRLRFEYEDEQLQANGVIRRLTTAMTAEAAGNPPATSGGNR